MASISLCMIVKNEEKVLERCLDSVKNAVDEIIIADTGSTDKTKEIAFKYTDRVFDFRWTDDFSAARNFSFSKAESEYVMWLDADDVLTPENCRRLAELKKNLGSTDTVMMKYSTAFDENGNTTFSYYRERIIRKSANPIWKGRVHEAIEPIGNVIYSNIEIRHKSIKTEYSTRNLAIYQKQLKDGEPFTPRDKFYYGRELYYHKKYSKAVQILNEFLNDKNGWTENKIEACKILSFCYRETGETEKAVVILFRAFLYDNPRAEICCALGNAFMLCGRYTQAVYWFELALTIPDSEKNGGFSDADSHGYLPCIQLCVCYDKLKNYRLAEEYNRRAGKYRPDSAAYLQNLSYFKTLHQSNII